MHVCEGVKPYNVRFLNHFYAHFIKSLKFIMMIDNANNNIKTKINVKIIESNEIEKYLDTHHEL